jgi:hypothetical protein
LASKTIVMMVFDIAANAALNASCVSYHPDTFRCRVAFNLVSKAIVMLVFDIAANAA